MNVEILDCKNNLYNREKIIELFKKRFTILSQNYPPSSIKAITFISNEEYSNSYGKQMHNHYALDANKNHLFINTNLLYKSLQDLNYLNVIDKIFKELLLETMIR